MASYTFDSDLATDQDLAFGDSSKLVRDGTRLTGNVQAAVARYEAADVYSNGDEITVKLGTLPAGVRIMPGLCHALYTGSGTFTFEVYEAANDNAILKGSASAWGPEYFANFDHQKLTKPTEIFLYMSLGAALPADFVAEITLAYSAPA